ncbi:hypothetical protein B7R78_0013420 [Ralstonia solanacearum]|uniref:hypothetical protein n=2 Tax=Ralstonia solanacearum TaxID=305 RepID=UPI001BDEE6AC|nr:hypothetical protein [Ralstonia solanacearum]MBT1538088.1 hypothetical protein [Ralstonia solanacearum]
MMKLTDDQMYEPGFIRKPNEKYKGSTTLALIQTTKRGQILMLDRRDGTPFAELVDRPAPQGSVPDERLVATQPHSVGMSAIGTEPITEQRMWGLA